MNNGESSDAPDKGNYEWDLWVTLQTCIGTYQEDREKYADRVGATDPELARMFAEADAFAESLLEAAKDLVSADSTEAWEAQVAEELEAFSRKFQQRDRPLIRALQRYAATLGPQVISSLGAHLAATMDPEPPESDSALKLVWERLCISLAWEGVNMIDHGASRLLLLWSIIVQAKPTPATLQYLLRMSRCYTWGFYPECVILSRGVLDTAFRDYVADEVCERFYEPHEELDFGLAKRISSAFKNGMISATGKKMAFAVKMRGDKAVHGDPHATKDVLGTIRDTLIVVRELTGDD